MPQRVALRAPKSKRADLVRPSPVGVPVRLDVPTPAARDRPKTGTGMAPSGNLRKLSVLMPVYNEQRTIAAAIATVLRTTYPCDFELIVVDDGSTDETTAIVSALRHPKAQLVSHPRNLGKGAALQTGACVATGSHLVPFDADLEYDAADLGALVTPILQGRCDVVYGARLFGANTRYQSYRHAIGNRALTLTANVLFNSYLSDIHTCLKVLPVELFRSLELSEDGFGLDTEITAKLLARGIRPFEVPVSYHSRSAEHGKKITWRDGVECLQVLARVRSSRKTTPGPRTLDDPLEALAMSMTILAELEVPDRAEPERPGNGRWRSDHGRQLSEQDVGLTAVPDE